MTTFEGHDLASYYNCRMLDAYETSILYIVFWRFDSITLSRQRLAKLIKRKLQKILYIKYKYGYVITKMINKKFTELI